MSEFSALQERLTATDKDLWLGSLVMYSVCSTKIKHEDLVKVLHSAGLTSYMPRVPEDSDVFRRVATAAQRKRVPSATLNQFNHYMVREVPSQNGVLKVIVRETVDVQGEKLGHVNAAEVRFDKASGQLSVKVLDQDPNAIAVAEEIKANYATERGCVNEMSIRELIRKILNSVNATNVRGKGGGAYFVSRDHLDTVVALEQFANALPATVDLLVIPFLDDTKRREYVREAFEVECTGEIKALLNEVADLHQAGKPLSGDKFATFLEKYHAFRPQVKEYEGLLETQLGSVHSMLDILKVSIMKLSTLSAE